jgi:predicted regulator of Ras-like GTPase activity (Roadblock/LC7/MglB family)
MNLSSIALHEAEYLRLKSILAKTQTDLHADLVLLIDRSGQQIASQGSDSQIDLTSLASLAAANIAATNGLAKVVGEPAFSTLHHQGTRRSIHILDIGRSLSLVLVFEQTLAAGMVRWKVRRAALCLDQVFSSLQKKLDRECASGAFTGNAPARMFSDEELDELFDHVGPKPLAGRKV